MTHINIHIWHPLKPTSVRFAKLFIKKNWVECTVCYLIATETVGTSLIEKIFGRLNNWALWIIKPCRLITHNWRVEPSGLAAPIPQYLILATWEGDFWPDSSLVCVSHFPLDSEQMELTLNRVSEWVSGINWLSQMLTSAKQAPQNDLACSHTFTSFLTPVLEHLLIL